MYISRIIFTIKIDQVNSFKTAAQQVVEAASQMPGCLYFKLLLPADEPTKFVLYEEWGNSNQADAFKKSKLRNEAAAKLAPTMTAPPEVLEYFADTFKS